MYSIMPVLSQHLFLELQVWQRSKETKQAQCFETIQWRTANLYFEPLCATHELGPMNVCFAWLDEDYI